MTNDQVENLRVGDYISQTYNGRRVDFEILKVRKTGVCINESSGAYGHAYACLTLQYQGSELVVQTSIHSDEYSHGEGYPTHDSNFARISGHELIGHNLATSI